jgi:hypothetical protein
MGIHRMVLRAAAGLLLAAMPTLGHHSFRAEYDDTRVLNLSGTITKVSWKNPHVTLNLDVKDESGKVTNWEMELASPNGLLREGWKIDSLKQGDFISVTCFGARDGSHTASARKVVLRGTDYSASHEDSEPGK